MLNETNKVALEAPRATTCNVEIDKFSIASLSKYQVELKIRDKISIFYPNDDLVSQIKNTNTFINPKFKSNQLNGYSNWQTSETIQTYQIHDDTSISLPRGFLPDLLKLCEQCNVKPEIKDLRSQHTVNYPDLKTISLRSYQSYAVDMTMRSEEGIIIAPTGSGKTICGLELIRRRKQKALIIVHRKELADQWIDIINDHTGIKAGFIGDCSWNIGNEITVAMIQTLVSREYETKLHSDAFGLVLFDEVHHIPAFSFFNVLGFLAAKYRYGLSATLNRRDGLEPIVYRSIGPTIAVISKQEVECMGATVPVTIFPILTKINPGVVHSWNEYLNFICKNHERNIHILSLVQAAKGNVLILVDRVAHAELLSELFNKHNVTHELAHGRISKKNRETIMKRIKSAKLTIGTTSLLGEGLDVSVWSTLIMGSPISSEIKLMQAIGRIVRPAPGKTKAFVYDLKDDCGFAGSSFNKRLEIYKKHEILIEFYEPLNKNAARNNLKVTLTH